MTTPAIMAYVGGTQLSAVAGSTVLPDWVNNRIIFFSPTATIGIRQFNAYSSGDEVVSKNITQFPVVNVVSNPATIAFGSYLVFISSTLQNSCTFAEANVADLSLVAQFGIASSSLSPSTGARIITPVSMAPLRDGTVSFTVTASDNLTHGEICAQTIPGMANTRIGVVDEAYAVVGPGSIVAGAGTAFVLGKSTPAQYGGGPRTDLLGLYVVTSALAMTKKGTISPAQIDATWTHFGNALGIAYDQTDGNPIIMVKTADVVTHQVYFAKLNKATAAVMWTCPVNAIDADGDVTMSRHLIANQTLYYMGSGGVLYQIDTSTGASASTVTDFNVAGGQVSEDLYDSITLYCSWSQSVTTPTFVGTYMGTQAHHSLTNQWARYFPIGTAAADAAYAALVAAKKGIYAESMQRAWTFTLDGHTFYVLDLGNEGTWVYDVTTSQWSQFITAGFDRWDVVNGSMWGQRIVGGDLASTDVWEVVPGAVKDNGALNIEHVATGALETRSRDSIGVDALRISASAGQLDDVTGATLRLRMSDDQGQTWTPYLSLTLTQGDFGADLEFRSLGSFASPGRIFEISDTGGLIRIDGCDAFLDGEEDGKSEE